MIDIFYILKVAFYLFLAVVGLWLLYIILSIYSALHPHSLDLDYDRSYFHEGSVFVYSKKFATLTGLDPAKAIDLPKGLEAIEFSAKWNHNSYLFGLTNRAEDDFVDMDIYRPYIFQDAPDALMLLYPGKFDYFDYMLCAFKLYVDSNLDLLLPEDNDAYLFDSSSGYSFANSLLVRYLDTGVWEKPPESSHPRSWSNSSFEDDWNYKAFLVDDISVKRAMRKADPHAIDDWHLLLGTDIPYLLEYEDYKKEILSGITYLKIGGTYVDDALHKIKKGPVILLEKRSGKDYEKFELRKLTSDMDMADFYFFNLPKEIYESEIYKRSQELSGGRGKKKRKK